MENIIYYRIKRSHPSSILIRISENENVDCMIGQISEWFTTTKTGARLAYDIWRVNSEEALCMFHLRFNAKETTF